MYYVEATANFNKPKKVIEDAIKKPGCLEDFHPFCLSNKTLSVTQKSNLLTYYYYSYSCCW